MKLIIVDFAEDYGTCGSESKFTIADYKLFFFLFSPISAGSAMNFSPATMEEKSAAFLSYVEVP